MNELEKLEVKSKIQENDNTETVTSDKSVDKTGEIIEKANKLLKSTKEDKDIASISVDRESIETKKSPIIQEVNE